MKPTVALLTIIFCSALITDAQQPDTKAPANSPTELTPTKRPTEEAMRSLAKRVCDGDTKALDTLCATLKELYRDLDASTDQGRLHSNYLLGRAAFDLLGQEAAKGNVPAFDALKAIMHDESVYGFAIRGMGIAAAGGHKESLSILLAPEKHRVLFSEAAGALIVTAAANIEPAVDFLIQVIRNPDHRPLHQMASEGLRGAAEKGNAKARAVLDELAQARPKAEDMPAIPVTLKVGDAAPKLRVGQWLQGDPVVAFDKDKAYLVEFWATWCGPCVASIPHLNQIHGKFKDKGLVVIGQNVSENEPAQIKAFIAKMGGKMTYRVALDDFTSSKRGAMGETWLAAAGQGGIPTAFLVGKDGRLAWIGHPAELKEAQIEAALVGK